MIYSQSIEGLDELIKAFADLPDEAIKKLKPEVESAGNIVLEKTKTKLPEGRLKRSLFLKKPSITKKYKINSTVTWGDDVRAYAAPRELGHKMVLWGMPTGKRVPEHPFLRPGADESKDQVTDIITGAMNKAINEMGGAK